MNSVHACTSDNDTEPLNHKAHDTRISFAQKHNDTSYTFVNVMPYYQTRKTNSNIMHSNENKYKLKDDSLNDAYSGKAVS